MRKRLVELEKYEGLYKDLDSKVKTQSKKEASEIQRLAHLAYKEQYSLLGHVKHCFAQETASYLELKDLTNLNSLSKDFKQVFLVYNSIAWFGQIKTFNLNLKNQLTDLQNRYNHCESTLRKLEDK